MTRLQLLLVYSGSAILLITFFIISPLDSAETATPSPASAHLAEMTTASGFLLEMFDEDQREKALMPFESDERYNFNFIPMERKGLMLKEMTTEQRIATHRLLQTTLSHHGYLKVTGIMHLEDILHILEGDNRVFDRDPEQYYVAFFGEPSETEPWGWRFEGHHLSLSFTTLENELFSSTPAFMGTNPAEVRSGPYTGLRVLAAEEDLGRALVRSLTEEQFAAALIAETAPREIITETDREVMLESYEGLPASEMTESQIEMLWHIVKEYAHNLNPGMAHEQLDRIRRAGIENLHFAWAGSIERGDPHYYRIHGPSALFEYDNVQNNANHIHTVWRDLDNDFGEDLLRRHYETASEVHGHDH